MKESMRERGRTLRKAHVIPECHTSAQGAEIHHSRVGEKERDRMGDVLGERRESEVLLASVKENEK